MWKRNVSEIEILPFVTISFGKIYLFNKLAQKNHNEKNPFFWCRIVVDTI
jgi:hypothetical protein